MMPMETGRISNLGPRRWSAVLSRCAALLGLGILSVSWAADFHDPGADLQALPTVPPGFEVTIFAREPLVRQPCSMAFDARGRLCIGMGPQYRNPKPDTPGDSVVWILDNDGDGQADATREFATGFNAIQGLAWRGRDLWVANAPDLTLVRDLDGDDVADEYVRLYTDLGNLEHGLHGLTWAPDGRLYMSKGNSKGLNQPGRYAPKAFRDLWGITAPDGTPDLPGPVVSRREDYRRAYHDPEDDWGLQGGVLRCDSEGGNLEIVCRGTRNPWDITFDSGFNWLGTDNDQTTGDRVFMPFVGAHFGWNHPWSAHWSDEPHAPTAPVSGPLFEGSGTGIVFADSEAFPASHRGVFLINDWLGKTTYLWRPRWDGALLRPAGNWEPFVQGGTALYRPTDLEFGPNGALWVLGWSRGYGAEYQDGKLSNEGRIFRVAWRGPGANESSATKRAVRPTRPMEDWEVGELLAEFDSPVAARRVDAQVELLRRGSAIRGAMRRELGQPASPSRETWAAWTLGRLDLNDRTVDAELEALVGSAARTLNAQIQAVRVLGYRARERARGRSETATPPAALLAGLRNPEARVRFEAVQALREARSIQALPAIKDLASREPDATTFYAAWQALRWIASAAELRESLGDERAGVRRAALLSLLEDHRLEVPEIRKLAMDPDAAVRELAELWLNKNATASAPPLVRGRSLAVASGLDDGRRGRPAQTNITDAPPVGIDDVLARLDGADPGRGEWLFFHSRGAGCVRCHRLENRGNVFGPDLATVGDRATARHIVESMLNPSAVITEGFNQHTVETADGELAGVLLEESGLSVTLGLASGVRQVIAKSTMTGRRVDKVSAMPAFDRALTAAEAADLAAYLLARKTGSARSPASFGVGGSEGEVGFAAENLSDRLRIRHDGLPVAEYVFRDDKILRPYFANVRAPNGAQVTRRHPPIAGRDAVDHDTMHPGLWMGFGDVSGVDFWRNKGRIEHERFVEEPRIQDGRLRFAAASRWLAPAGNEVCRWIQRFEWTAIDHAWLLVWEAEFFSDAGDFVFGDQEEMGLGARVSTSITEKNGGRIQSSTGLETAARTWGKGADWCDYSGTVDSVPAGLLLMASPANFRGSWWHNRDYGVFVANPFGRAAMEQGDPSAVRVRRGERFKLRFGVVIHAGRGFEPAAAYRSFVEAR
ncbi:MAG: PmoA family protein [Verrucomicrobiales bacterium]|nr:PmoA family protein [Verrucomicrobiales bacterium]